MPEGSLFMKTPGYAHLEQKRADELAVVNVARAALLDPEASARCCMAWVDRKRPLIADAI